MQDSPDLLIISRKERVASSPPQADGVSAINIYDVLRMLKAADIKYSLGTMHDGGRQYAIIAMEARWRTLGVCQKCYKVLDDKRFNECEECRDETTQD